MHSQDRAQIQPDVVTSTLAFWNVFKFSLQSSLSAGSTVELASGMESCGYRCHELDKVCTLNWSAHKLLGLLPCPEWAVWQKSLQVTSKEKSKVLSLSAHSPVHPWEGKENPALVLPPLDVRFGSYMSIYVGKSKKKNPVLAGLQGTVALKPLQSHHKSAANMFGNLHSLCLIFNIFWCTAQQ